MHISSREPYKSLPVIDGFDAPSLMVLSGVNGVGKSQFLEGIQKEHIRIYEDGLRLTSIRSFTAPRNPFRPQLQRWNVEPAAIKFYEQIRKWIGESRSDNAANKNIVNQAQTLSMFAEKNVDELTLEDVKMHYPAVLAEAHGHGNPFYADPATTIIVYEHRQQMNEYHEFLASKGKNVSFLTESQFVERYGPHPTELLRAIADVAGLKLQIKTEGPSNELSVEFVTQNGAVVDANALSSGEHLLVAIGCALYNAARGNPFPQVILLDEVGSVLHPGWMRRFMDAIISAFVEAARAKVVIVTHSPSMVALAPERSVYLMTPERRVPMPAKKDLVLGALTVGVPSLRILHENRCQVFVESVFDEQVFSKIYQHLHAYLNSEVSLSFIAVGDHRGGGCDGVIEIVRRLREGGNDRVFGMIDRDKRSAEPEQPGLFCVGGLERYSIENFLLDPLVLAFLLLEQKPVKYSGIIGVERFAKISSLDASTAQRALEAVVRMLRPADVRQEDPQDGSIVSYAGGIEAVVPAWYLNMRGHDLVEEVLQVFPELNQLVRARGGQETGNGICLRVVDFVMSNAPELVPAGILKTYRSIQNSSAGM